MSYPIEAQLAQQRHGAMFNQLVEKILASKGKQPVDPDPAHWAWSYENVQVIKAEVIDLSFFAQRLAAPAQKERPKRLVGRELLADNADSLTISLRAKIGRRSAELAFDNQALLSGPDGELPLEALGVRARPAGPGVWLWRDDLGDGSYAWHEYTLHKAIQTPKGLVVDVVSREQHNDCIFLPDPTSNVGRTIQVWDGILSGADLTAYVNADRKNLSSPKAAILDPYSVIDRLVDETGRARLLAPASTVSELLAALQGPGFMAFGDVSDADEPAPDVDGPWIDWNGQAVAGPGRAMRQGGALKPR